jgi:tetratricopeptide (TPR) repeat protein
VRTVYVFVSSPSDAADERKRVVRLIERLNVDFSDVAELRPVLWEDRAYEAHEGFQEQIRASTDCDVVIAVLRGRVGTPLAPGFVAHVAPEDRLGLGPTLTGTTYEIVTAIAARRHGKPLPDIYAFRYAFAPAPALNAPDRAETEAQWRQLEAFVAQVFFTPEGYFKGALEPYRTIDEFETSVDRALRQWLAENVIKGRAFAWPIGTKGSPFRGLEPFGAKHSEVFFGRHGDRIRALERLKALAEERSPFLLVVGPSGAGKSSFVRAGVAPDLIKPGVIGAVGVWRVAVMRPSDGVDALDALARRLFDSAADIPSDDLGRPPALPELAEGDSATREQLRALFNGFGNAKFAKEQDRADARGAVTQTILRALARVSESRKSVTQSDAALPTRLIILIDQFDEIFAAQMSAEGRAAFARVLEALLATGSTWIVATIRAESFGAFLQSPLASLLQSPGIPEAPAEGVEKPALGPAVAGERTFNLLPPNIADIGEIVRAPAAAAGLEWQTDSNSGQRLDDRIIADVDRPDLLPLLQFVLQQLFEQRETINGAATLTWAAYSRIGSLDGAINTAGNRALEELNDADRAALPKLLRALVALPLASGALTDPPPILRQAAVDKAAGDQPSRNLIKALTDARILVSRQGDKGESLVELAHQRVIEAWKTARDIIAENKTLLRIREDVDVACKAWLADKRSKDGLMPPGRRLANAEAVVAALKGELQPELIEFVAQSGRAARRRQRMTAIAAAGFLLLAVLAAGSAYFFFDARNRAERNLVAAKQAIRNLDDFIWSANQGAQSLAGARLDKVQTSLGQLQQSLDQLLSEDPDNLDLLATRAGNFANFVDAYLTARSIKDAQTAAEQGLSTAARMAELDANDPRTLKAQIMASYKRADVRKESRDLSGALADCREAERLATTLVAKTGADLDALRLQWVATEKLGEALMATGDADARQTLERSTGMARSLMTAFPTDPARRRDLALSLAGEGREAETRNDPAAAVKRFGDSLQTFEQLVADHPSDPLFVRDKALALVNVGLAKFAAGDPAGANSALIGALEIARRNAKDDALNARARHDLLAVLVAQAGVNMDGDKTAARASLDEALQVARSFAAIDGGGAQSRYDLATVLMKLALNFDDTSAFADEAKQIVKSLAADGLLTPADKATFAQFEQLVR